MEKNFASQPRINKFILLKTHVSKQKERGKNVWKRPKIWIYVIYVCICRNILLYRAPLHTYRYRQITAISVRIAVNYETYRPLRTAHILFRDFFPRRIRWISLNLSISVIDVTVLPKRYIDGFRTREALIPDDLRYYRVCRSSRGIGIIRADSQLKVTTLRAEESSLFYSVNSTISYFREYYVMLFNRCSTIS